VRNHWAGHACSSSPIEGGSRRPPELLLAIAACRPVDYIDDTRQPPAGEIYSPTTDRDPIEKKCMVWRGEHTVPAAGGDELASVACI
jgi:hypothetical protein